MREGNSEFREILPAIRNMDADVMSIEAARSRMDLLADIDRSGYGRRIGLVHSSRVPEAAELEALIRAALRVFRPEQLWIHPDCGLKTRQWEQVRPMLANIVAGQSWRAEGFLSTTSVP